MTPLHLALIAVMAATPALGDAYDEAPSCLKAAAAAGTALADCVNRAHTGCIGLEPGSAEGVLCFQTAKTRWGALIATRMEEIGSSAPEEIAQIAGIEVKYDLQINLLQCDRMEDLSLLTREPDTTTLHARALCEASAVGLSYVRLMARSGALQ